MKKDIMKKLAAMLTLLLLVICSVQPVLAKGTKQKEKEPSTFIDKRDNSAPGTRVWGVIGIATTFAIIVAYTTTRESSGNTR